MIFILVLVKEGSKCSSFSDEETVGGGVGRLNGDFKVALLGDQARSGA